MESEFAEAVTTVTVFGAPEWPAEGTERVIDGCSRVFFGGYWIRAYPIPKDSLFEKRRLIEVLTRRLFNHVEHGMYVPGTRLEDARAAYDTETDSAKRRVKGGMLAGALFNRAADILTRLVELQQLGVAIASSDPLMRLCGQHLQEALGLGKQVLHRSGDEGIDELWGEPFKAFAFPVEEFYTSRYIKLSMTMRCIDELVAGTATALSAVAGFFGVGELLHQLGEAGKAYAESLRSDPEVFDTWSTLAVARERLCAFQGNKRSSHTGTDRELTLQTERLVREVSDLLFAIARARVPMPKSAVELCHRCQEVCRGASAARIADAG